MHANPLRFVAGALVLTVLTYASFAGADKDAIAKDKKALQGGWTAEKDGMKMSIHFDGEKFKIQFQGKTATGSYTIDPSQKPKSIDMHILEGSDADTKKYEGKTSKAIYELDGDSLKWLANEPGGDERPAALPGVGESPKGLYAAFERDKR